jgi:hypothetical protein
LSGSFLYVRDIQKLAAFYQTHFGLKPLPGAEESWLEIGLPNGGCSIALHQAAASQKRGAEMKIVFGVKDVRFRPSEHLMSFTVEGAIRRLTFYPTRPQ